MNSHDVFINIHQGCFTGTGAIVRLPQCQWSKHSKAKTVCTFLGIYCISLLVFVVGRYNWGYWCSESLVILKYLRFGKWKLMTYDFIYLENKTDLCYSRDFSLKAVTNSSFITRLLIGWKHRLQKPSAKLLTLIFPWTKWPPFRRRCFQMHFREWSFVFWSKFHWSLFLRV